MCAITTCVCCFSVPLSVIVAVVAIFLSQIGPKNACQKDGTGACIQLQGSGSTACDAGVFVELAKQPFIGLRHLSLAVDEDIAFASLAIGECTIAYSLTCKNGAVQVSGSSSCIDKVSNALLGESWEVCSDGAGLSLTLPVIDLTYDMETSLGQQVDGCVRISAPKRFSHLDTVRGSIDAQRDALAKKKKELGGCPTWSTDEDRYDRGDDYSGQFGRVNGFAVRQLMKHAKSTAIKFRDGIYPETSNLWGVFLFAAVMISGGGEHAATVISPSIYCGAVGVSALPGGIIAVQVTRHSDVAEIIGDPKQKKIHQIGGGNSEVCFEPTLPVFLSTGEPPHTQVRKLWDAAGLATMHLSEISEIVEPPPSLFFKVRAAAMSAVGMHAPVLDEIAPYVAPLFLEKLWGKKPTPEESAEIGAYGTVGGPCIMSQIVEKVPFVPGKILAIRAAVRAFARESPVGKKMAEEIFKPEYAELKALYASRPLGVVDGALGALADASLFAGLIGTSTMTMNAMVQIHRGQEFLKMFRQNSTAFMLEVMRTATAVAGSLSAVKEPWKLTMLGEEVTLPPKFKIMQLTGMAAGLDPSVFPEPYKFDSNRPNLGETQNFNGLSTHVLTRSYSGAPRFCPGAALAMKIATKVVDHFTKGM